MLLTTSEYARAYNTSDRTARRLCESGELRCVRFGRGWLIQADAKTARHMKEDTNAVRE